MQRTLGRLQCENINSLKARNDVKKEGADQIRVSTENNKMPSK